VTTCNQFQLSLVVSPVQYRKRYLRIQQATVIIQKYCRGWQVSMCVLLNWNLTLNS